MISKIFLILIFIGSLFFVAANPVQIKEDPVIVPIYVGDYFTGNVYVKQEGKSAQWCSYVPELNKYGCKEFGK